MPSVITHDNVLAEFGLTLNDPRSAVHVMVQMHP